MRQLATNRSFFEPAAEFGLSVQPPILEFNHMLMLALEQARVPPVVHSRHTFQPMRVIVINPTLSAQLSAIGPQEAERRGFPARLLPPAVLVSNQVSRVSHRAVRGEILSDARGHLYEKLGRQIRPIHQLASGPSGEVIDLIPSQPPKNEASTDHSSSSIAPPVKGNQDRTASTDLETQPAKKPTPTAQPLQAPGHRKLFADPGQWRVVWWGEFKEILARQLAHPERLRDTYRLPCYVQVIETERTVSIAELASIYQSEKNQEARLYVLTEDIAAKLDLILPLRPAPLARHRQPPNSLAAHERVFRLLIANDPTIDVSPLKSKQPAPSKPLDKPLDNLADEKTEKAAAGKVSPKTTIPDCFIKEWEFRISREEAIYDIDAKPTFTSRVRNFFRSWRIARNRNEISKWQTLLAGRSGDEQLWSVRPPANMIKHPFVRDWATRALELAGYDSQKMFHEWQIFWGRRGC